MKNTITDASLPKMAAASSSPGSRIFAFLLSVALVASLCPAIALAEGETAADAPSGSTEERLDNEAVETSKTIAYDSTTDAYTLRLESYVTGDTVTTEAETSKATDFVLAIDNSKSMPDCINCGHADVDDPNTGKYKNTNACPVYLEDLDPTAVYEYDTNSNSIGDTAVWYCTECGGWYTAKHVEGSHSGTLVLPKHSKGTTCLRQFYTQGRNENCGESCTHKENQHPIYANQVDTSQKYRYLGSDGELYGTALAYCEECEAWYRVTETTHVDGGTHKSNVYYPKMTGSEAHLNGVVFYEPCISYMTAAKQAIATFINETYEKSKGADGVAGTLDDVHHRIALVAFCSDDITDAKVAMDYSADKNYTRTGLYSIYDESDSTVDNFKTYHVIRADGHNGGTDSGTKKNEATYFYQHALRDVTSSVEMAVLDEGLSDFSYGLGTMTDDGVEMALNIFNETYAQDEAEGVDRNRVLVVFTDGLPACDGEGNYDRADEALEAAYEIKNNANYDASVYSVGVFAGANASQISPLIKGNAKEDRFMHMLSSNYPTAWSFDEQGDDAGDYVVKDSEGKTTTGNSITVGYVSSNLLTTDSSGNTILDPAKQGYYLTASDSDSLVDVFEIIVQEEVKGGTDIELDSESIVQDVLTDYWQIDYPEGSSPEDVISAYTMAYTGDGSDDPWAAVAEADELELSVNVSDEANGKSNKTISVTGFDFTKYYVGTDEDIALDGTITETAHGRKLVVEIPVMPTVDNPGGIAQPTNVKTLSGIFDESATMIEMFDSPKVDIPVKVGFVKEVVDEDRDKEFDFRFFYRIAGNYSNSGESGNYLYYDEETGMTAREVERSFAASYGPWASEEIPAGSKMVIEELEVSDYTVDYSIDGGATWTPVSVDANGTARLELSLDCHTEIIFRNTKAIGDLTILKDGLGEPVDDISLVSVGDNDAGVAKDAGENALFLVESDDFSKEIIVAGNGSVTINDLSVGTYSVTELTDWTWSHTLDGVYDMSNPDNPRPINAVSGSKYQIEVTPSGATIKFVNEKDDGWIYGDCWCRNVFNKTTAASAENN